MDMTIERYGVGGQVSLTYAEAVAQTKEALQAEGFGVLCEIDVQATLKAKLNADSEPYLILGACAPQLAQQALAAEPDMGLFMPCNLVVYQRDGIVWVKAIEVGAMATWVGNPAVEPVLTQVREKLARVLASVGA